MTPVIDAPVMHGASEKFEADCGEARKVSARRLFLADSDSIFLHGLAAILGVEFPIAGEATTGIELLKSVKGSDVLIMGFTLACGRNALGLLPELRRQQPDLPGIILISPTAAGMVPRLYAAGARGVLSRRTNRQDLVRLVLDAIGGRPLPPLTSHCASPDSTAGSVDLSVLTQREMEIFRLIGQGKSGREMGALLGISEKTISSHRENIKAKFTLRRGKALHLIAASHAVWETTGVDYVI